MRTLEDMNELDYLDALDEIRQLRHEMRLRQDDYYPEDYDNGEIINSVN